MINENKIKLFLVDDDAVFLKSLEIEFLQNADFNIETFATGELTRPRTFVPIHGEPRQLHRHYTQVVDADLKGYFDSIPHPLLKEGIEARISDGCLLELLAGWLR